MFFWDLDQDTHIEISRRSTLDEDTINLEEIEDDDDDGETWKLLKCFKMFIL